MRIASRAVGEGKFLKNSGFDDVVMLAALLPVVGVSVCSVLLAEHGLGKDIWMVPFDSITFVLQTWYYDEIMYLIALALIKISLIMTYLRIFPNKQFRTLAYVLIAAFTAYMIAYVVVTIVQCTPIPYAWTQWDGEHAGVCRHINAQVWCAAALNIIMDLIVVVMPMPLLWQMHMNTRKKLLIMLMFGMGIFVTVISVMRLQTLIRFDKTQNITWDYTAVGYFSTIEMHASVFCACMPGMRRLVIAIWPRLMGATSSGTHRSDDTSGLSGRTALGSKEGGAKARAIVSVRRQNSDDSTFISLHDMDHRHSRENSLPYYEPSIDSTVRLNEHEKNRVFSN
ncbi:hypothetical protein LTR08_001707 [Meristemomyces frigidus]|nr:hypothetical protein LTR08_001707 [Meristemomyces frigidus]